MLTLEQVRPFLDPETLNDFDTERLTAMVEGVSQFIEEYTNLTLDAEAPKGLCMVCAEMVLWQVSTRPHLKQLESEDMKLVFNTSYPPALLTKLTHYRRLRW